MQAAKEAARNFLPLVSPEDFPRTPAGAPGPSADAGPSRRDRQHDTEVCEAYKPAVTRETVIPRETIEETIAVDREVHQDHYQIRIQPIEDKVRAAEKHEQKILPIEHREQRHGKDAEVQRKLELEAQQFKSTTTILPVTHVKVSAGTVSGEHVHHHVHEKVQPVVEREVIEPTIIHTTIPIHERIEHEPTFHPATVQPKMTMEEFLRAGGVLEGRSETCGTFEGEPEIKENGGAGQTHPNARGFRGHGVTARATTATPRPRVIRMMSGGDAEQAREMGGMRGKGVRTPPIGAN